MNQSKKTIFFATLGVLVFIGTLMVSPKRVNGKTVATEEAKTVGGYGEYTTGGTGAKKKEEFTVTNREELVKALGNAKNSQPKIINIKGTIDMSQDTQGKSLRESDYEEGTAYRFSDYLKAYDPSTYGKKHPSGRLEEERVQAQKNQAKQISIHVPANTTIIGENGAKVINGTMIIEKDNVIVKNIMFEAPYDYFPQWDPTDGKTGNWNSQYDAISIQGAKNVWLDHNTFTDGNQMDSQDGTFFGRDLQHHDGLTDITNGADQLTLSNNRYQNHDKTILIGNSDHKVTDKNKLHVSLIGNVFENTVQRTPRVRYGDVQLINNLYKNQGDSSYPFQYAWGLGKESHLVAKNNVFDLPGEKVDKIARKFGGNQLSDTGTRFNGKEISVQKLLQADSASLSTSNVTKVIPSDEVTKQVEENAGAILNGK